MPAHNILQHYVNLSPRLEASTWSAKEDMDATGGRGSRVHNRLAVVIGAGSLVVEVATALAGQAQQWVSEFVPCGGLSWLPVSFLLHVKYTLSYLSYNFAKSQGTHPVSVYGDSTERFNWEKETSYR